MIKYECSFRGRLCGAIGILYNHAVTVESDKPLTDDEVYERLYGTHEHISRVSINSRPAEGVIGLGAK